MIILLHTRAARARTGDGATAHMPALCTHMGSQHSRIKIRICVLRTGHCGHTAHTRGAPRARRTSTCTGHGPGRTRAHATATAHGGPLSTVRRHIYIYQLSFSHIFGINKSFAFWHARRLYSISKLTSLVLFAIHASRRMNDAPEVVHRTDYGIYRYSIDIYDNSILSSIRSSVG